MSKFCGCAGCLASADVVVEHPDHGQRVVCEGHVGGLEVIGDV